MNMVCFFFYLSVYSSVSFGSILQFSVFKFFITLIKFNLRYFIDSDALVKGIALLHVFQTVYCWCVETHWFLHADLQLCWAQFLAVVAFLWFLQNFLYTGSCYLRIESFTSFFPGWMSPISFSCLIALARVTTKSLSWPRFREKAVSLSWLSAMLAVSFSFKAFYHVEEVAFYF